MRAKGFRFANIVSAGGMLQTKERHGYHYENSYGGDIFGILYDNLPDPFSDFISGGKAQS